MDGHDAQPDGSELEPQGQALDETAELQHVRQGFVAEGEVGPGAFGTPLEERHGVETARFVEGEVVTFGEGQACDREDALFFEIETLA